MAECQKCGNAVIVPRPYISVDGIRLLVCNTCFRQLTQQITVESSH